MNTVEHNGFLLVEVPEGVFGYSIIQGYSETFIKISDRVGDYNTQIIPKGNYSIVGLAKELTEDQWKEIVHKCYLANGFKYENYQSGTIRQAEQYIAGFDTATESGASLLKSHSLEPSTTLILKKL